MSSAKERRKYLRVLNRCRIIAYWEVIADFDNTYRAKFGHELKPLMRQIEGIDPIDGRFTEMCPLLIELKSLRSQTGAKPQGPTPQGAREMVTSGFTAHERFLVKCLHDAFGRRRMGFEEDCNKEQWRWDGPGADGKPYECFWPSYDAWQKDRLTPLEVNEETVGMAQEWLQVKNVTAADGEDAWISAGDSMDALYEQWIELAVK